MDNTKEKWSTKAWDSVQPLLKDIYEHDFLKQLQAGTLDKSRFHFYIQQDGYYLSDYGKTLAGIGTKLPEVKHRADFMGFAQNTIGVEQALHGTYRAELGDFPTPVKSPTCELYTSYLAKVLQFEPIEVALAAVLPCFWIYKAVGDHLLAQPQVTTDNPYQAWINTYSGEDFAKSVATAIEITDFYAGQSPYQKEMMAAFQKASQLEWLFWDSAFQKEEWPHLGKNGLKSPKI